MSKIKETLLIDNYVDLYSDFIDDDYQYEAWLEQQNIEDEYYAWLDDQNRDYGK